MLLAGCETVDAPRAEVSRPHLKSAAEVLSSLAEYSLWLDQQGPEVLATEREQLQAQPASAERDLKLALLNGRRSAADSARLDIQAHDLQAQLEEAIRQRTDLEARLDAQGNQLETERTERARLERQLRALKSLEEQIKDRDEANSH